MITRKRRMKGRACMLAVIKGPLPVYTEKQAAFRAEVKAEIILKYLKYRKREIPYLILIKMR